MKNIQKFWEILDKYPFKTIESVSELIDELDILLEREINKYLKLGFKINEASIWIKESLRFYINPKDAYEWTQAGFSIKDYIDWNSCSDILVKSKDAKEWLDAGLTFEQYCYVRKEEGYVSINKMLNDYMFAKISIDNAYDFKVLYNKANPNKEDLSIQIEPSLKNIYFLIKNKIILSKIDTDKYSIRNRHNILIGDEWFRKFINVRKNDLYKIEIEIYYDYIKIIKKTDKKSLPNQESILPISKINKNYITII